MGERREVQYKGFWLWPNPLPVGSGEWGTRVQIRRDNALKQFTAENVFPDRDTAATYSLDFGIRIIDDRVPGLSGADLP